MDSTHRLSEGLYHLYTLVFHCVRGCYGYCDVLYACSEQLAAEVVPDDMLVVA